MDIVTLGAALNGSAEYVNSHFKGGSNIQIVDNPDGTQTINASGEVSSEDTVARAEIAAIQDGETLDSFGDVEAALGDKADTSTTYTKTEVDTALSAKANSADVYSKTAVDTALSNKADKSTTYTKTEVDTSLSNKADKSTTYTKTEVDTALDDKVDKVSGKGLSTNDFTTAEKTKLDSLAEIKTIGTGLDLDSKGELTATGGGGGGFTPTDAQLDAMNSGITEEDVEQISTNKNNISKVQTSLIVRQNDDGKVLTASYSGGTGSYSWVTPTALKSYTVSKPSDGSVNTATFDWSQLANGRYLITCKNVLSSTDRYGISVYVFEKWEFNSLELWTPISDITNAKISSYVVSSDTLTLTYDVQGYHTVKIVEFNT